MLVVAAVLLAALLHASWNATAHALPDREVTFFLINVAVALVPLPVLPFVGVPAAGAWPFLLGSVLVHLAYNLLLLRSYQLGDFGQTYPLARGTAPLVVALVGVTLVGQRLTLPEVAGVLAISGGLLVLVVGAGGVRAGRPAVLAAVATGLSIATYTVLDGVGVRRAGPEQVDIAAYIAWLFVLQGPLIAGVIAFRRPSILRDSRPLLVLGLLSGVVSLAAYGLVLFAQTSGATAAVAALRESSIVFGALMGTLFLGEQFGRSRVVAAVVVTLGIVLVSL